MDRRLNKTKALLKETLTDLLEEKDLRSITVKEITERANINRGTFYLHYLDIYDMIEKLEDEIINNLLEIIETNNPINMDNYYLPVFIKIVEYFYQDKRFCKALLGKNGDINFIEKMKKTMCNYTMKNYKTIAKNHDPIFLQYLTAFIVSGGIGAFQEWFNDDCKVPLKSVIHPVEFMISTGIKKL